jgi:hypothetical protein
MLQNEAQVAARVRPWGNVTLDGRKLGTTPMSPVSVYEGPHTLEVFNPKLKAKKTRVVMVKPRRVTVIKLDLSK